MKKIFSLIPGSWFLITGSWFLATSLFASVNITKVSVMDSLGNSRTSFSSNEKISMRIESNCTSAVSRIYYRFYIMNPSGVQVFYHDGNSTEGNVGSGAASLRNIPLSSVYSSVGIYTFKGEVVVDGIVQDSKSTTFTIYSPQVTLTYPPDGVKDLIDKPVTFRWMSSGASKYKIYVDDEMSFFNPIWTDETSASSISYPLNPSEDRQKLSGGVVYYWKVEGLSADGSVVATSPTPFSFSLKEESQSTSFRNIAITDIKYDLSSNPPDAIKIIVDVANQGSQSVSNLKINLFIDGAPAGNSVVSSLLPGSEKNIIFAVGKIYRETVLVTATADIADEVTKDNILTKAISIPLPDEWRNVPKIIGRVVVKGTKNGVSGIRVKLEGVVNREDVTKPGGLYKFEKLSPGQYKVKVEETDDYFGGEIQVNIADERAYPVDDIEIEPKEKLTEGKKYTIEESWKIVKDKIKDKKILEELAGYKIYEFNVLPYGDVGEVVDGIKQGKIKIENVRLKIVK
ncbi:MAG: hypothetical protein J7L54_04480 [Elusimicrobia bacterium]|nr:hypothetical protein [Elusimicrobiota bacterium]